MTDHKKLHNPFKSTPAVSKVKLKSKVLFEISAAVQHGAKERWFSIRAGCLLESLTDWSNTSLKVRLSDNQPQIFCFLTCY